MAKRYALLTKRTPRSFRTLVSYDLGTFNSSKSTQFSNCRAVGATYKATKENVDKVHDILLERYLMLAMY
eukprot:5024933-Amphidinium_carterae.1